MRSFICLGFVLLLATQVNAEIYSWVDDSGTYNYTEDYSGVPKCATSSQLLPKYSRLGCALGLG